MSVKTTRQTPAVLRVSESALAVAPPRSGDDRGGCSAWLSGPAGSGTARILHLEGDAPHPDLIVVDYPGAYSRSWVLHSVVGELAVFTLLAEAPTSFPSRSHALAG
ncbi:hypothetical protein ACIRCZ_15780 [Leifsonia sp. NPDC102414]|jgi:hypothetical protein|uniref:hypothetical protein n=1 Tax=unclassified Leifsonia TaxID=2663824 RepID=UPI000A47D902|nr:hypothetical protein [Leifsonia sp. Root227]